jgi:hypothetical protein
MFFFKTFFIILGAILLSFHLAFWEMHKMDFWQKTSHKILVTFQMSVIFQQIFMFSHTYVCLNEKVHPIFFCEITRVKIFIQNWNDRINSYFIYEWVLHQVWWLFEWFLEYICTLQYIITITIFSPIIFFNHLISISKWFFYIKSYSLGSELPYSKYKL